MILELFLECLLCYHGNNKQTQMELGEEQITVGQPALRSGRPGDTQGTEEDQRQDGGTT